jgi:hypothetical protein
MAYSSPSLACVGQLQQSPVLKSNALAGRTKISMCFSSGGEAGSVKLHLLEAVLTLTGGELEL